MTARAKRPPGRSSARRRASRTRFVGANELGRGGAGVVLALDFGVRPPADLMVAGFDDIPDGARSAYNLTTVRQPIDRMVEETLSILHLDDPHRPIERGI